MHTSIAILPSARHQDLRVRFPARGRFAVLTSAWQRWRTRRAASALRRRALDYLAAQPSLAADLAAAAGCALDDLIDQRPTAPLLAALREKTDDPQGGQK